MEPKDPERLLIQADIKRSADRDGAIIITGEPPHQTMQFKMECGPLPPIVIKDPEDPMNTFNAQIASAVGIPPELLRISKENTVADQDVKMKYFYLEVENKIEREFKCIAFARTPDEAIAAIKKYFYRYHNAEEGDLNVYTISEALDAEYGEVIAIRS